MTNPVKIADIIKGLNFTHLEESEAELQKSSLPNIIEPASITLKDQDFIKVNMNIQRMPLAFLGDDKERVELENKIKNSSGRIEIYRGEINKEQVSLSIAPSITFGLLSGFDLDVLTVIQYKLFLTKEQKGKCPKNIRLWISDFPRIMGLKTHGRLYQRIRESIVRLSETTIYQDRVFQTKSSKNSPKKTLTNIALKLILYNQSVHSIANNAETKKSFVDIEIPDWIIENIEYNYTTELNIKLYFSISSDRSRYLYRLLDLIRFKPEVRIYIEKLYSEMFLNNLSEEKLKKRGLVRALDQLVDNKYIKSYRFKDKFLYIEYVSVKDKQTASFSNEELLSLTSEQALLLDDLINKLDDPESKVWFIKVIKSVPPDIIRGCLSIALESERMNTVIKSKGAIFTHNLMDICDKRSIGIN